MQVITFTTDMMESHMYLAEEGGHVLVIDPADGDMMIEAIESKNFTPDRILLTHEHCDHSCGADAVRHQFGCKIYASETCSRNLMDPRNNYSRYFDALASIQTRLKSNEQRMTEPFSFAADVTFSSESRFSWQGHEVLLKETPGHSAGSICILIGERILFPGDTLLWNEKTITRFISGSKKALREVTIPWLESLDGDIEVYPGHLESFRLRDRLKEPII